MKRFILIYVILISTHSLLEALRRVVVFGSTGKTGQQVVKKLLEKPGVRVVCTARNQGKARKIFGADSSVLTVFPIDLVSDSPSKLANLVRGADAVVFAAGNSQLTPTGAYDVDYRGTMKAIDACIDGGVRKFVLISSLLANGLMSGQLLNPQYLLLNLAGGVLFWKREAEKYLQSQPILNYTIGNLLLQFSGDFIIASNLPSFLFFSFLFFLFLLLFFNYHLATFF